MLLHELIAHYRRVRSLHGEIGESLESKLRRLTAAFGHLDVASSSSDYAEAAYDHWPDAQPNTIRRYLVQLQAVLNRAERDGLIQRAPVIDKPAVYDVRDVDVSPQDIDLLLDFILFDHEWAYPGILFLAHTGARLGEAFAFDPTKDFLPHGVRIRKPVARRSKTVNRIVPYTGRMKRALDTGTMSRGKPIFTTSTRDEKIPKSPNSAATIYGRVLTEACNQLGLPRLRLHDLRHAFAAIIASAGGDLADIAAVLGHTNTFMAMRYRGLVPSRVQRLLRSV